jgi:cyclopropane fatty-acyl-phospholipid synthase-like methyltransferase
MAASDKLASARFPRTAQYHPDWIQAGASSGANCLWLTEWLTEALELRHGMRILDLGCGRAMSSIFLAREFGVQVWAADLWFSPSENHQRIRDAGVDDRVFPLHADAHTLPFATEFFDAIVSIDSFFYYGTDDLYLNDLARFVKPGGRIGIAQAGLTQEIDGDIPEHLRAWWSHDRPWFFHSAAWWRRHWGRTGVVDIEVADSLEDGWQCWSDWLRNIAPDNTLEIAAVEADHGRVLTYVRTIGRRRADISLYDPVASIPANYTKAPLLRSRG